MRQFRETPSIRKKYVGSLDSKARFEILIGSMNISLVLNISLWVNSSLYHHDFIIKIVVYF